MANDFNSTVGALFNGMDSFLSSKTVVGEPTMLGDTILLPLVDVSFGVGAGAYAEGSDKKTKAGGGMGGKMTPSAVLVIQNGKTRLVNVKNQETLTKLLDLVPDLIDRVTGKEEHKTDAEVIDDIAAQTEEQ